MALGMDGNLDVVEVVERRCICRVQCRCIVIEESLIDRGDVVKVHFDRSSVAVLVCVLVDVVSNAP